MERFGAMQLFHLYYSGEIGIVQLMKEGSRIFIRHARILKEESDICEK